MNQDLDAAIASEEHAQGRPYLADPEHCDKCAEVDRAWALGVGDHEPIIQGLIDRRGELVKEMETLLDGTEDGYFSGWSEHEFQRLRQEVDAIDVQLRAYAEVRLAR